MKEQEWIEKVESNLEGVELFSVGESPGCYVCAQAAGLEDLKEEEVREKWSRGEMNVDPHFSWSSCESCGSALGGDRYPAHGMMGKQIVHFHICADCLMYHANGDLPDGLEPDDDEVN